MRILPLLAAFTLSAAAFAETDSIAVEQVPQAEAAQPAEQPPLVETPASTAAEIPAEVPQATEAAPTNVPAEQAPVTTTAETQEQPPLQELSSALGEAAGQEAPPQKNPNEIEDEIEEENFTPLVATPVAAKSEVILVDTAKAVPAKPAPQPKAEEKPLVQNTSNEEPEETKPVISKPKAKTKGDDVDPRIKIHGDVEFDLYAGYYSNNENALFFHEYFTTANLDFAFNYDENWYAQFGLQTRYADRVAYDYLGNDANQYGDNGGLAIFYRSAFIEYMNKNFTVRVGDFSISEGAIKNYFQFNDPAYDAAGMKEHDIRGIHLGFHGLEVDAGFGHNENDYYRCHILYGDFMIGESDVMECGYTAYDIHIAYNITTGENIIRPYLDYKSYQELWHNELHLGLDLALTTKYLDFHGNVTYHDSYMGKNSLNSNYVSLLLEPSLKTKIFLLNSSIYYAFTNNKTFASAIHGAHIDYDLTSNLENMFVYVEPKFAIGRVFSLGIPFIYHTNGLYRDIHSQSLHIGPMVYVSPFKKIEIKGYSLLGNVLSKDEEEKVLPYFGLESKFAF